MSLFKNWLDSREEDRVQVQKKWRTWIRSEQRNSQILKDQWSKPVKFDGYWRDEKATQKHRADTEGGVRTKGYVTLGAQTNANSYASVLDSLEQDE